VCHRVNATDLEMRQCAQGELPDLVGFQPLVLLLPAIQRLLADPHLPDQLRHWYSHLSLLQHGHDLLHRKALPLHGKSPFLR
jgi:hypothetical protein